MLLTLPDRGQQVWAEGEVGWVQSHPQPQPIGGEAVELGWPSKVVLSRGEGLGLIPLHQPVAGLRLPLERVCRGERWLSLPALLSWTPASVLKRGTSVVHHSTLSRPPLTSVCTGLLKTDLWLWPPKGQIPRLFIRCDLSVVILHKECGCQIHGTVRRVVMTGPKEWHPSRGDFFTQVVPELMGRGGNGYFRQKSQLEHIVRETTASCYQTTV